MKNVTLEAIKALATEQGKNVLDMITELQGAAAVLGDEATLDALCEIKWQVIG